MLDALGRVLSGLERRLGRLAGLLLIALLVLINIEVVARYFLGRSTLIADEYGGYLMAWITMLGAIHLLRADRHLTMTWLVDRMSPRKQNWVGLTAAVIGLGVSVALGYATAVLVYSSWRFGTTSIQPSATPLVWPQLLLPFGYALLCVAYVEEILRRLAGLPPRRTDDVSGGIV
jgi:TRAP-type C4-dicarboxylate transport system permease small subunit